MNKMGSAVATKPSGMVPGKTSRGDLRHRNWRFLLRLIQMEGPISQAKLARRSGLGPASVSSILQTLIENGVLAEEGKTTSGLGRKASLLAFNRREVLTAGVVIEQESCEWGLGRGHENFICLEIGSGVGAGIVCDGRVLRGPRRPREKWAISISIRADLDVGAVSTVAGRRSAPVRQFGGESRCS
jgi:hypothetical protein